MRRLCACMVLFLALAPASWPAHASAAVLPPAQRMLDWAQTQAGKPYAWGGTGPGAYDCSGLVFAAARHAGMILPRTTYAMIHSRHLVRTRHPRRGDLAFFGPVQSPFHVEFVTAWRGKGFGAQDYGTPVGYDRWGGWWQPSAYYRVR